MSLLSLGLRRRAPKQNARGVGSSLASDTAELTQSGAIGHMLKRLCSETTLLTVTLAEVEQQYTSTILSLNSDEGHLFLDELSPQDGHERIALKTRVRVQACLDGIDLSFRERVAGVHTHRGIAFYELPIPDAVRYNQRRASHRVPVSRSVPPVVILEGPEGRCITGELREISLGGMGVQTKDGLHHHWVQRGSILGCTLELPDQPQITAQVEIRHLHSNERSRVSTIGACFKALGPTERRTIQRYIAAIERELVRKRSK